MTRRSPLKGGRSFAHVQTARTTSRSIRRDAALIDSPDHLTKLRAVPSAASHPDDAAPARTKSPSPTGSYPTLLPLQAVVADRTAAPNREKKICVVRLRLRWGVSVLSVGYTNSAGARWREEIRAGSAMIGRLSSYFSSRLWVSTHRLSIPISIPEH